MEKKYFILYSFDILSYLTLIIESLCKICKGNILMNNFEISKQYKRLIAVILHKKIKNIESQQKKSLTIIIQLR